MKITSSAMFVAWSPIRSKRRETKTSRIQAARPFQQQQPEQHYDTGRGVTKELAL